MKIIGTKYCGHDSAICLIDTNKKSIFAMSTERVTRIKHDSMDITPILSEYNFDQVDYVSHSYNDFKDEGKDGELREQMTFNKDIEKAIRLIVKPTYIKDLSISRFKKNREEQKMDTFIIIATVGAGFIFLFWFILNLRDENRRLLKRQGELLTKIEEAQNEGLKVLRDGQSMLSKTMYKLDLEERAGLKTLEEISKNTGEKKQEKPEPK